GSAWLALNARPWYSMIATIITIPIWGSWDVLRALVDASWPTIVTALLWATGATILIMNLRRLDPRGSETATQAMFARVPGHNARPPWFAQPSAIQLGVAVPWLLAAALAAHHFSAWASYGTTNDED